MLTEFLTQSTSLERMRRLADRTLAIKMAEEGADFCQLYQFFLAHGHDEAAAYDCARRVCRGGLVEGGAPVHEGRLLPGRPAAGDELPARRAGQGAPRLRAAVLRRQDRGRGRAAVRAPGARGDGAARPTYLPEWARDLSYLTAFMSYSAFLGECDLVAGAAPLRGPDRARRDDVSANKRASASILTIDHISVDVAVDVDMVVDADVVAVVHLDAALVGPIAGARLT